MYAYIYIYIYILSWSRDSTDSFDSFNTCPNRPSNFVSPPDGTQSLQGADGFKFLTQYLLAYPRVAVHIRTLHMNPFLFFAHCSACFPFFSLMVGKMGSKWP